MIRAAVLALALAAPAAAADPWQGREAAFFGVTYLDTSYEGEVQGARADETARVEMVERQLADALVAAGLDLVDLSPVAEELERTLNPAKCYGCELRMAERLGADYTVVSEVQKVSNLILSLNVVVRDVATGAAVRGLAVDIRGNTDESWQRGMDYVLTRGIFTD
jgi:hypothetical protein